MSNEKKFIQNKLSEIKSVEKIDVSQKLSIKYFLNEIKMFRSFKFKKCAGSTQDLSHPIIFLRDLILKNYYRYKCKTFDYDSLNNLENFATCLYCSNLRKI